MKRHIAGFLMVLMYSFGFAQSVANSPTDISPLLIGENIPETAVQTLDGNSVTLKEFYQESPVVLVIYRGGWCPFCNVQLSQLKNVQDELIAKGFKILAVSPDSPESLQISVNEKELPYILLSDASMKLSMDLGIAFQAPERYTSLLQKSSNGANPGYLPVPSVFLIDTSGIILFEYINPNYKTRISEELLLAATATLSASK